ncbi:MAG: YgiQ family radical SAM protein [Firmicutes bacterium]|nr:YgiQ family radical SAM protein [Bacillota bacterium]
MSFLPLTKEEMLKRNWEVLDFIIVSGDAYVDHPSFGMSIVARLLEAEGFRVGIIAAPDLNKDQDFTLFGAPTQAFMISAGNMDSMVSNYTAAKKRRSQDDYAPGGKGGLRPNRASIANSLKIRELFPQSMIILGGIEASLRRHPHYDYWEDTLKNSIIAEAQADLLIYGMAEKQLWQLAEFSRRNVPLKNLKDLAGTAYLSEEKPELAEAVILPSLAQVRKSKREYARSVGQAEKEQNPFLGKPLIQKLDQGYLVVNPPAKPLSQKEMDAVYDLPYERTWHPLYDKEGGVPALAEVEFSITSHRGCFGGCNFCAITSHQGRIIQNRSHESILKEIEAMTKSPRFKGYIHDIGGPSANFRIPACAKQEEFGACNFRQCLFPENCPSLVVDHSDYFELLRKARKVAGVKKVFVRSGIRYDFLLADPKGQEYLEELCLYHISGQLKVAPEHVAKNALDCMGKPGVEVFDQFRLAYAKANEKLGLKQYLVPYLMTSHPGCHLSDAIELAEYVRDIGFQPQQVQDFIPTPGSISTAMYYSGYDPITLEEVTVIKSPQKRRQQRALLQYKKPENRRIVHDTLLSSGRQDLIGHGEKALVPPLSKGQNYQRRNSRKRRRR